MTGAELIIDQSDSLFLRIDGLPLGIYTFELAVSDNTGEISRDTMTIEAVNSVGASEPEVLDLVLIDGFTNQDVMPLKESMILNLNLLNLDEINIEAICNANTSSLKFSINTDQKIRIVNNNFFLRPQINSPEWEVRNGHYEICATPYSDNGGRGVSGIMQCYKISVYDQPVVNFYSKPEADLSQLDSWEDTPGGILPLLSQVIL